MRKTAKNVAGVAEMSLTIRFPLVQSRDKFVAEMSLRCRWQTVSRLGKVEIFCRWDVAGRPFLVCVKSRYFVAEMSLGCRWDVAGRPFPVWGKSRCFVAEMSLECRRDVAGAARQIKIPDLRHLVIPLDHETKNPGLIRRDITERNALLSVKRSYRFGKCG